MGKVEVTTSGAVLVARINRPEVRGAIDTETAVEMDAAMDLLESRNDLSVGVITGTGIAFCAGMDLKAFAGGERPSTPRRGFAGITENQPSKPLIAAVNGHAVAGGLEVVLACDLIVAAESAMFGLPEVKRGLVAAGGALLRLPERIPHHIAMEWVLTGAYVTAQRAREVGLANYVVSDGTVLDKALELAHVIASNGPLALAASKRTILESPDWPIHEAFARGREISEAVRSSEDAREGSAAFLEKRQPVWSGR